MTTRAEALAAGADRYFDESTPCRKGHPSGRYTSIGKCVECVRLMSARRPTKGTGRPGRPALSEGRSKPLAQRVASRKSIPLPKLKTADVEPLLLPLIELKPNQCRYPYDTQNGVLFCGLPKMQATPNHPMPSYCPEHFALCTEPWRRVPKGLTLPSSLAA
jgi:hypothetical protein